jgi:hypothetical protein
MLKPVEKPKRQPLIHHPSNVLDVFGQYDATNHQWLEFDDSVSQQLAAFEARNQQYLRPAVNLSRRISSTSVAE